MFLLINPLAIWLPWLELLAGLSLIIGVWTKGGALVILILSAAFAIALGSALFRGLDITCGCFHTSATTRSSGWITIAQDLGLLIMGLYILQNDGNRNSKFRI